MWYPGRVPRYNCSNQCKSIKVNQGKWTTSLFDSTNIYIVIIIRDLLFRTWRELAMEKHITNSPEKSISRYGDNREQYDQHGVRVGPTLLLILTHFIRITVSAHTKYTKIMRIKFRYQYDNKYYWNQHSHAKRSLSYLYKPMMRAK